MTAYLMPTPDPKLDLQFERVIDVPRDLVWEAWTTPEHLLKWFTPAPWRTTECEIDLRPGGMFRTVMCSPEGELFPGMGSYVEVVPNERLIWTNALLPGFRPNVLKEGDSCHDLAFTTVLTFTSEGSGTRYSVLVIHGSEADCKRHAEMGFHDGWGKALDQLVTVMTGK